MARHTARYDVRSFPNILDSLRTAFGNCTAFEREDAIKVLVRDFSCQRATANRLLEQVTDEGYLITLMFLDDGTLWKVYDPGTDETTELDTYPRFVRKGSYQSGLEYTNDRSGQLQVPRQGESGLAFPEVFAGWLAEHQHKSSEKKDQEKQRHEEELAKTRADHPELAPLDDFNRAWEERAEALGKVPPVTVHIYQSGTGTPLVSLNLRGKRADAAAADLLAVLEKHFPLARVRT